MARILIACEFSGVVREAFRKHGHDAWSCDIRETEIPGQHFKCDVLEVLNENWDALIAFPPCTYLTNTGVQHLYREVDRYSLMLEGAIFFKTLLEANIEFKCIENPIMHSYALDIIGHGKHTQIIHPYWFGHTEQKATCLWLRNLPKLVHTNWVYNEMKLLPEREQKKKFWLNGHEGAKERSRTYQGVADAMGEQWHTIIVKKP